ncbi:MAG: type II secretion system protein GspG [Planctomycetota bacterium]
MSLVAGWALVGSLLAGCASRDGGPAYAGPAYGPPPNLAPAASSDLGQIEAAVRRYAAEHGGRLPTTLDDLVTETGPDGSPYLRRVARDPWGGRYDYAIESSRAGTFDLRSYGPDRLPATGDDVVARGAVARPD